MQVSIECVEACAHMRAAGAYDMDAQTPGHACEFFCEADRERGFDSWPTTCLSKAVSSLEVHDCWLADAGAD